MTPTTPETPTRPVVVGLLGGVAAGKSAVSATLARHGLVVLDADRIAREVLESPEARPGLLRLFGPDAIDPAGQPDRAVIADRTFRDQGLRAGLERLVHPAVHTRLEAELEAALAAGHSVVLDVPLLLERGWTERCDHVVFIDVPLQARRQRATARGMTEDDWARREAAQAPLADKRAAADTIVDNSGSLKALEQQIDQLVTSGSLGPRH